MIEVKSLYRSYRMNKETTVHALDGISFEAQNKDIVAVVGASGSGKSTLLNVLGGLDREYEGQVLVEDRDIKEYNPNTYRREMVGTIFQQFNLISALSVEENVLLPTVFRREKFGRDTRERALYLLDKVGLSDRLHHRPNQLSGGQMQRVAIARALIGRPRIILADEPTGNLDSKTGKEIMNLLYTLNSEEDITMFIVTHDLELVKGIDRKIFLKDGKIIKHN